MGAGFHGGFGDTYGAKQNNVPVNDPKNVRYSKKKTEEYLLNINHPIGGSKAKFMKDVLGYSQSDSKLFHKNVVASLVGKSPTKSETTPFGIKHTYNTKIIGKSGKSSNANVVVVIQKDNSRVTYKIVTIYPDKKGR
ncbi:DUF6883 domain-containing protein [Anaerofustis sp. HA2171]|uniref:DUF6883 domain-containing protein n=1 Tax=Anaerofustis butyriciformans TaxID=3108533 RepID=UPI002E325BDF|nr:DUF6883 domain-containing protein [Anaerofustis sp. HA2171]